MLPQPWVDRSTATLPNRGSVTYLDCHFVSTVTVFQPSLCFDRHINPSLRSTGNPIDGGICLVEMRWRNTQYVQPW